jgi:hypothetical protein
MRPGQGLFGRQLRKRVRRNEAEGQQRGEEQIMPGYSKTKCPRCGGPMSYKSKTVCRKCYIEDRPGGHEGNPNWKGGRFVANGYVRILMPEHPRADDKGYVREHIVIWENANHRTLPKDWHIHHLNGITTDNRPSNLLGLPDHKHVRILAAKAKRIQELEALLLKQGQLI